jgi:hypothetical protein
MTNIGIQGAKYLNPFFGVLVYWVWEELYGGMQQLWKMHRSL